MVTLSWKGVRNARDLGGLRLRSGDVTITGRLIRCGELDRISVRGRQTLLALEPSRIIDLRSPHEVRAESPLAGHAGYRHLPFIDAGRDVERVPESERTRSDLYRGSLERNGAAIGRIWREIADAPAGPVIVHCRSGVDRTGLLAALLLDVAGVVRDAIVQDYLAAPAPIQAAGRGAGRGVLNQPLTGQTMIDVLAWLDEHGGASGYLRSHGVPEAQVGALRRRLTHDNLRRT